jgi:hypothetical protein
VTAIVVQAETTEAGRHAPGLAACAARTDCDDARPPGGCDGVLPGALPHPYNVRRRRRIPIALGGAFMLLIAVAQRVRQP